MNPRKDASEFGRLAVALGFLTADRLREAVAAHQESARNGDTARLGEILIRKKFLTREQVLLILRAQGKRILVCKTCRKSYNIHGFRTDETYQCKHCEAILVAPTRPIPTAVTDSVTVPSTEVRVNTPVPPPHIPKELVHLLNGYEIQGRLGQGGMGTVYKARDKILDRWVAVKILAPFLATNEEYIKRFFVEARNLQKLDHEYIVQAFDAGEAGDHKFFIMEYVPGPSVDKVIEDEGKIEERRALEITERVARALDYAWHRKIVHRDVKPQNIMLKDGKTPKLCDLGLSKDTASDISLTISGSVNCSPPYASPEQAQGLRKIDCRTDSYSLGVTLYQMVVGELPFLADGPGQFLIQHVTKSPPHPLQKNPKLLPATARLILRMLEKNPDDRPTPGAVADQIAKILNGAPAGKGSRR